MPQRAHVKRDILIWARESMCLSLEDAEKKIGAKVSKWESGELEPTVVQLREACRVYKRPMAAFFLPEPPTTFSVPYDYRRLPGEPEPTLSPEFLGEYRVTRYRREVALSISEQDEVIEDVAELISSSRVNESPEKVGAKTRPVLLERATKRQWPTRYDAFNAWREAIESFGVLVTHFSRVAVEEVRGYTLTDTPLPIIGINGSDSINARIFTLLHEFAHILLGKPGISDQKEYPKVLKSADQRVERWCNAFAAEVLVPRKTIELEPLVRAATSIRDWGDSELEELADHFSVSRAVILGRLLTLGKISEAEYWPRLHALKRAADEIRASEKEKTTTGGPPVARTVVRAVGKPFARMVVGAYDREAITSSDLAEYLGMRLKHLGKVREALSLRRATGEPSA